jgi:hypothetical protein
MPKTSDILIYARLASEAVELVGELAGQFEREQKGQKVPKAEIDKAERRKKRLDELWKEAVQAHGDNVTALPTRNNRSGGENDTNPSA